MINPNLPDKFDIFEYGQLFSFQTVHCTCHREVRLGGWGTDGPKGPTLGQYVRVRVPPFRWEVEVYNEV